MGFFDVLFMVYEAALPAAETVYGVKQYDELEMTRKQYEAER